MKVDLVRSGAVAITGAAASNPGRCGSDTNSSFKYTVTLRCDSNNLNGQDFVMDHLDIQRYFDQTYTSEPLILSCEMIAMRALMHFYRMMQARIEMIEVNIIAESVSHRASWHVKYGAPIMPPIKNPVSNVGERWRVAA